MRRQNNFPCSFNARKTALSCSIAAVVIALSAASCASPVENEIIGRDFTTIPAEGLKFDLALDRTEGYQSLGDVIASRYIGADEIISSSGSSLDIFNTSIIQGNPERPSSYFSLSSASVKYLGSENGAIEINSNTLSISNSSISKEGSNLNIDSARFDAGSNALEKITASDNVLIISNNSTINADSISAAKVDSRAKEVVASDNRLEIRDSNVRTSSIIYGVMARPAAEGRIEYNRNSIQISNSEIDASRVSTVYSTQMNYVQAKAVENILQIENSNIAKRIIGVSITQSNINQLLTEANRNSVSVSNSTISEAYSVSVETSSYEPYNGQYKLIGNSLDVTDSRITGNDIFGSFVSVGKSDYGGSGSAEITDSFVNLTNTTASSLKNFRAAAAITRGGSAYIKNSVVELDHSIIDFAAAGAQGFMGAITFTTQGGNSIIEGTTINVASSNLTGTYFGSYAALSSSGTITGTTFNVSGDSVLSGNFILATLAGGENSIAADNKFIVRDKSDLSDAEVWGYNITSADFTAERNQFIASNWTGSDANGTKVKALVNFNEVLFGPIAWNENGSAITVLTGKDSLAGTKIGALDDKWIVDAAAPLESGDKMKLIDGSLVFAAEGGTLGIAADAFTNEEFDLYSLDSAAVVAKAELSLDEEGSLWITAGESGSSGQANQLLENRATAAAYLNSTEDLIEDALASASGLNGVGGIALAQGNAMKYDTRSEVKLNGWSGLFGAAVDAAPGMTAAAFFEAGDADYRTWNDFAAGLRGDGRIEFYGLGAAIKKNFGEDFSAYAGLRGGMMRSEMNRALAAPSGEVYDLSSDSWYWSAQVGAEKRFQLSDRTSLAVSGKFVHTYVEGGSEAAGADRFTFDSIDSDRLQAAVKLEKGFGRMTCAWIKAGLAYEFSGDSRMSVNEFSAPEQSLEGTTGIFEAGGSITPDSNGWRIRGIVRGYAGRIEGLAGQISAVRAF